MSIGIPKWDYNRMLGRRVNRIEKTLKEIEQIKYNYGTMPEMTGICEIRGIIKKHRKALLG